MRNNKIKGNICIVSGLLLLAAALFLNLYNRAESNRAGEVSTLAAERLEALLPTVPMPSVPSEESEAPVPSEADIPDYLLYPEIEMPTATLDGVEYIGLLKIPALDLELPVISTWNESLLKLAPCRYAGSAYLDDLVICAHNYRSHFGALKNVRIGDEVTFTDVDGNVFTYEVADMETLSATAIEDMINSDWELSLFTCTMGGKTRLAVRCQREDITDTAFHSEP